MSSAKKLFVSMFLSSVFLCGTLIATTTEWEEFDPTLEEIKKTEFIQPIPTKEVIFPEEQISLLNEKPELFYRPTFCNIDTISDSDGTHVNFFNPDIGIILSFSCIKDENQKDRGEWEECIVKRKTRRIYNANLKIDNKFEGYRDKKLGIFFEKLLRLTKHYNGTFLADEYKSYALWNVSLKDKKELLDFIKYLATALESKGIKTIEQKPVLLLSLKDDPTLSTLGEAEYALLNMLFEVVAKRDIKTTELFTKIQNTMNKIIINFEKGSPIYLGESVRKRILRKIEGYFETFDPTDLTSKVAYGTLVLIGGAYQNEIKSIIRGFLPFLQK